MRDEFKNLHNNSGKNDCFFKIVFYIFEESVKN